MQNILAYNPSKNPAINPNSEHFQTEIDFTDARWEEHVFNPVPFFETRK